MATLKLNQGQLPAEAETTDGADAVRLQVGTFTALADATNVGAGGVGVVADPSKTGSTLRFKSINTSDGTIVVVDDALNNEVDLSVDQSLILHQSLSGAGVNDHATIDAQLPTADQKGAMDAAVLPSASNPFVTLSEAASGGVVGGANINTSGVGVFDGEVLNVLQFRGIAPLDGKVSVQLGPGSGDISVGINEAQISHTAISNIGLNSHLDIDSHIADATIHGPLGSATPVIADAGAGSAGVSGSVSREDHKHSVETGNPVTIGTTNLPGTGTALALANHTHAHGSQPGGSSHAVATETVDGFMSAADKEKLDATGQTVFIFQPGGVQEKNIYTSWADLITAIEEADGLRHITFDDSIVSPCVVPPGAYDMSGIIWQGNVTEPSGNIVEIEVQEGVTFTNLDLFEQGIEVDFTGSTPPIVISGISKIRARLDVRFKCSGTGPFIRVDNAAGLLNFEIIHNCQVLTDNTEVIDLSASGADLTVTVIDRSEFQQDVVSGVSGSSFNVVTDASGEFSLTQTNFSGTTNPTILVDEAALVEYDPSSSPLTSTNVQGAVDEHANDASIHFTVGAIPPVSVDFLPASAGTAPLASREDHRHQAIAASPVDIGSANAPGVASTFVRSDHVHSHGAQTDPTQHAVATNLVNGFMSAADKQLLDGLEPVAFTFQPGGVQSGNIYTTWTDLYTAVSGSSGKRVIAIDDSLASASIPAGAYDFTGVALVGQGQGVGTALEIVEGVTITGLTLISGGLAVTFSGTTPPIVSGGSPTPMALREGSSITCSGAGNFINASGAGSDLDMVLEDSRLITGSSAVINRASTTSTITLLSDSSAQSNTVTGASGQHSWRVDSSSSKSTTQTGLTATILTFTLSQASRVQYSPVGSPLTQNTVQSAIDEHTNDLDIHRPITSTAPVDVSVTTAAAGAALELARQDHQHSASVAAPSQGIGGGNTEGSATTLARSDHDHTLREGGGQDLTLGTVADGLFLQRSGTSLVGTAVTTVSSATPQLADATVGSAGASADSSRADHVHQVSTASPTQGIGAGNLAGTAATLARSDHDHTIRESGGQDLTLGAVADGLFLQRSGTTLVGTAAAVVSNSVPQAADASAGSAGAAADASRSDHAHQVSTAAPGQGIGGGNAAGTANTLSRSDHDHAIRTTDGPTDLTVGAVADGEFFQRSGTAIIGASAAVVSNDVPQVADASTGSAGASAEASRSDHAHQVSTAAPGQGIGGGNSAGVANTLSRSDHDHAIRTTDGPTDLTVGAVADGEFFQRSGTTVVGAAAAVVGSAIPQVVDATVGAAGVSGNASREDHSHQASTAGPAQGIGGGNAAGVANSLSRSDHDHALRTTDGPTDLTIAAVLDGEFLQRSGTTIVSSALETNVFTSLVFRPGGVETENVFTSWANLITELGNAEGKRTILFDDSLGAISIPAGTYDMTDVTWAGPDQPLFGTPTPSPVTVTVVEGVNLPNLRRIKGAVTINFTGTTAPVIYTAGPEILFMEDAAVITTTGNAFININMSASGTFEVNLLNQASLGDGVSPVINLASANSSVGIFAGPLCSVFAETFSGVAGSTANIGITVGSVIVSTTHTGFAGTFSTSFADDSDKLGYSGAALPAGNMQDTFDTHATDATIHRSISATPPVAVDAGAASAGVATETSARDHKHTVSTAAPSQGIGGGNAVGVATTLARSDHDHAIRTTAGPTDLTVGSVTDGQILQRSGTTLIGTALPPTPPALTSILVSDHFITGNTDTDEYAKHGWRIDETGAGAALTTTALAGHPGIAVLGTGTASTGRTSIHLGEAAVGSQVIVGGTNDIVFECLVRFITSIGSGDLEIAQVGLGDDWAGLGELLNGVYIRFNPAVAAQFALVAATAGTRTAATGTTSVVLNTWYRIGYTITDPGGTPSIQMTVNGANEGAAVTTNIPTTGIAPGLKIDGAGGVNTSMQSDYYTLTQDTDLED